MTKDSKTTYPQGSLLFPKEPIAFKVESGHTVRLHCGQSVWVCNSQLDQSSTGIVKIARSGKSMGYAWPLSLDDISRFFQPVGSPSIATP